MNPSLAELYAFLSRYAETLEEMAGKQEEKYSSLLSFDSAKVFKSVSELQASTLQIEKLEEKRQALQEAAGFGQMNLREILSSLSGQTREQFEQVFHRMQSAVWNVKFLNEKALSFAQQGVEALHPNELTAQQNLYASPKEKVAKSTETKSLFDANY